MNHTLSDSQLEEMIKSAVNSSGPLPPDEKFSQLISALRELQERRKADSEPVAWKVRFKLEGQPGSNFNKFFENRKAMNDVVSLHELGGFNIDVTPLYLHSQPAAVVPDDVLDALQKVARIHLDLNDFDGDRRGIADCLGDAEEALIEVVNRRAAMLNGGNDE